MAPTFRIDHMQPSRCSQSKAPALYMCAQRTRDAAALPGLRRHGLSLSGGAVMAALFLCTGLSAHANEAEVVSAKASCDSARVCSFDVTVRHADTGWDHYANAWRVVAVDGDSAGKELGKRVLHHPHENEQPFTRSLSGVAIPNDTTLVDIEAFDSVHEGGGPTFRLNVPDGTPAN